MEYYEEVVNDLAEKLEKMKEEKEDLQLISNALGDRLQRMSKEKDEALTDATNSFNEQKCLMESEINRLQKLLEYSEKVGWLSNIDKYLLTSSTSIYTIRV